VRDGERRKAGRKMLAKKDRDKDSAKPKMVAKEASLT
jgi:hypothetical protein